VISVLKFNPTTPIVFYTSVSEYVPGVGQTETWQEIGTLYGEWRGSFGDRRLNAQALGVSDSATVRTFYHPDIYSKMKTNRTVVIKNADATAIKDGEPDKLNPNCYEVWGGVDNVLEANQYMEFSVRRYEGL
jgi:head-tail adaptor